METFQLHNSDLKFSRMAMGTWGFSGAKIWGESDDTLAIRTIHAALDAGITALDTAARYGDGRAEQVLGRALADGKRSQAVVCSKVHADHMRYDEVISQCEESLLRMNTDYIDLYQIHWPNRAVPLEETLSAFARLKQDGKIREIGVCNFGKECLQAGAAYPIILNQLPYSLLWRVVENNGALVASEQHKTAVWAYSPLAQGLLTGKFRTIDDVPLNRRETRLYSGKWEQGRHRDTGFEPEIFALVGELAAVSQETGFSMAALAMAFLKAQGNVASILVGSRNPEQLAQNLACFEMQVPADVVARITALSEELRAAQGTNADLWVDTDGGRMY